MSIFSYTNLVLNNTVIHFLGDFHDTDNDGCRRRAAATERSTKVADTLLTDGVIDSNTLVVFESPPKSVVRLGKWWSTSDIRNKKTSQVVAMEAMLASDAFKQTGAALHLCDVRAGGGGVSKIANKELMADASRYEMDEFMHKYADRNDLAWATPLAEEVEKLFASGTINKNTRRDMLTSLVTIDSEVVSAVEQAVGRYRKIVVFVGAFHATVALSALRVKHKAEPVVSHMCYRLTANDFSIAS